MYHLKNCQIKQIVSSFGKDVEAQKIIFQELNLNPYDFYEDENVDDYMFNIVVYRKSLEERVNEVKEHPSSFDLFSTERIEEIENGSPLTENEISSVTSLCKEELLNDEFTESWIIAEMTDGNISVFALYFEQMWGQAGLHINEFLGFFATYEEAHEALKGLDLVDV